LPNRLQLQQQMQHRTMFFWRCGFRINPKKFIRFDSHEVLSPYVNVFGGFFFSDCHDDNPDATRNHSVACLMQERREGVAS
jgi:hypothetical protein